MAAVTLTESPATTTHTPRRILFVAGGFMILLGLTVLSLFVGSGDITSTDVITSLQQAMAHGMSADNRSPADLIMFEIRIPRTLLAIIVGAALGLAGALIQALTRNPLADPGILGVNAGAYTAVVFASVFLGPVLGFTHVIVALFGSLVAALVVYTVGNTGLAGGTPSKLVLTGVALGAVLTGISVAVTLLLPSIFDKVRYWSAGSLQGRGFADFWAVLPFIVVGIVIALFMPRALNALSMGDDLAVALGSRPMTTRIVGMVSITLLCGAATAAAGPISFVGLIVPHALRTVVGPDQRWLIPTCLVAAPILLLSADILGRVATQAELPAGVVTAFLGAPVLIALVRSKKVKGL